MSRGIRTESFVVGTPLQSRFQIAIRHLQDWLTRHDRRLFDAHSVPWDDISWARIAIDPHLRLGLKLPRRAPIDVRARALVSHDPLTFYFADTEAVGEDEAGGRVLASLFADGDRDKLALAWSSAWAKAERSGAGGVTLAEDSPMPDALESLFQQASGARVIPKRAVQKAASSAPTNGRRDGQLPARRLKQIEELTNRIVELVAAGGEPGTPSRRRGLREDAPPGRSIAPRGHPAPVSAPLAYSELDKEELALLVLQAAINGESTELRDYRHLRGVGADALDKLRRYFEIKSSYGPLPDEVTLTANEAERALLEGDRFFLAVVAGLEQGYETVVKIFPNPLRNLQLKDDLCHPRWR